MMLCTHQRHKKHKEPGIDVEISSTPLNHKDEATSDERYQDALQQEALYLILDEEPQSLVAIMAEHVSTCMYTPPPKKLTCLLNPCLSSSTKVM
jgi:hypothetical protein